MYHPRYLRSLRPRWCVHLRGFISKNAGSVSPRNAAHGGTREHPTPAVYSVGFSRSLPGPDTSYPFQPFFFFRRHIIFFLFFSMATTGKNKSYVSVPTHRALHEKRNRTRVHGSTVYSKVAFPVHSLRMKTSTDEVRGYGVYWYKSCRETTQLCELSPGDVGYVDSQFSPNA